MARNRSRTPDSTAVAVIDKVDIIEHHPKAGSYPPISSIPRTSIERLARAAAESPHDAVQPGSDDAQSDTILYLAYGSNMCAETFLGMRKVRPLSHVNVSVPMLRLVFNLAGIPYREPCFANVDFRKLPEKPPLLPDPTNPPTLPPLDPPGTKWDGGLIGVVYEVTHEDWRTIMKTEGGGSSYKEVLVPCLPIAPRFTIPEKPPLPELPKPFLARTLYAPYVPPIKAGPRSKSWWYQLITGPHRPDPTYAQPSARYLKLLRDGAWEHDLPDYYQEYLASLQPYKRTRLAQTIGQWLLLLAVAPLLLIMVGVTRITADENGKAPKCLTSGMTVLFNLAWMGYDWLFRPIFGDGERTEESDESSEGDVPSERRPLV